jgi:hypothetical protein
MDTSGVNVGLLKRFGIVAVAILAITGAIVLVFSPTDASRLKSVIEQRFPPTTKRLIVESWLASERITFYTLDHLGDTVGNKTVLEIVGLREDALGPTIRAHQGLIYVYFFFDRSDGLVKYWLDDGRNAF